MPKEFGVLDLLSKLSTNSFLLQVENERVLITPGIFINMPGKFYLYEDVIGAVMQNLYVNGKGDVVINIEDLQQNLKPLDLNEYFTKLEKSIKNKDILGLSENSKQYPIGDVKIVENKELPQPSIGELEPNEKTEQNETEKKKQTESKTEVKTQQTDETESKTEIKTQETKPKTYTRKQYSYQKSGYNKKTSNTYQKNAYNRNSANGNTYTSGKSEYSKKTFTSNNGYKKSYKKSENK